jgi:hypothetical protein
VVILFGYVVVNAEKKLQLLVIGYGTRREKRVVVVFLVKQEIKVSIGKVLGKYLLDI